MAQRLLDPRFLFTTAAVLLLAVGVGVVYSTLRFVGDNQWVVKTTTILRELDDVATMERRAVAAQRGYLLTSEVALRDEFWDVRARLAIETAALRASVVDAQAVQIAGELEPLLQRRMAIAARTLSVFEAQGLDAARAFIAGNGSRALDRQIRALLAKLRARELDLLARRRAALDRSANLVMLAAALGIPASLGMLFIVNRALVRENAERRRTEQDAHALARSYKALSSDMAALGVFAGMLQSCEDTTELLAITERGFANFAPALAGTVYLLRASRDHAEAVAQWGTHAAASDPLPLPAACWAVRRNRPHACDDVRGGIACAHVKVGEDAPDAATACLPLSAQGTLMGWLYLSRPGTGPLAEYEVALQAAEQMSLALANLQLQEDLRHQSIRDPLTGLYNRRYLEESLAREIARCERRNLPLAVLMLDLDHFKAFNDHHGHPGGDALLSAFGRLVQSSCRPEDIPCRFGGEEFTLIQPEATLEAGIARARAILAATAQMVVSHQGVPLGRVTTSIGVSALPVHGTTATALVEAADKALYQAKKGGRNQACDAEGSCHTAGVLGEV
jgi:diguanylate cyclase (GGDEF)-like protein